MNTIYTFCYNRPDLIELQYFSIKENLKNEFKFVVVNNAKDKENLLNINKECLKLNLEVFYGNGTSGLAGEHHQQALNNCWKQKCIYDKNYVWILDCDVFLIKKIEINDFMKNHEIACPRQNRKPNYNYITPGVAIFNMNLLPEPELISWSGCSINGVGLDTGGETYFYLEKYKDIKNNSKDLFSSWHINKKNNNLHCIPDELMSLYDEDYGIEFFGNEFVHYRASSNWDYKPENYHINKTNFIKKMVLGSVDGSVLIKEHNYQLKDSTYFGWNNKD